MERKINAMLKIVGEASAPIGSAEISSKLKELGISMTERTVRYHLKTLNEKGLIKIFWKEGRMITSKGKEELNDSLVFDKVGLMSSRIESMAYKMEFNLYEKCGSIILNISLFNKSDFNDALKIMSAVFENKLSTGELVAVAREGEILGAIIVPDGKIAFGTLCSININGILLKHSIPIDSKFGALLQMEDYRPHRFTDIINYDGSTLDPHEIFVRSKMTSVQDACLGKGKILAGLSEIPAVCANEVEAILRKVESAGIGRALMIGKSGQAILGVPIGEDRVGIVVPGGLNPVAAAEEAGIKTESKALVALVDYKHLRSFDSI